MKIPAITPLKTFILRTFNISQEKKFLCSVCNKKNEKFNRLSDDYVKSFDAHMHIHPFFAYETLNVFDYECPYCHSTDRDRLYALYFKKRFALLNQRGAYRLIDFAPQPGLAAFIKKYSFISYRSADLYMQGVDDVVDITDMKIYSDESTDIFICSHILEHVYEDQKAIAELYRILKPNGFGIIMVPILLTLKETYENQNAKSEAERWKHFGQFNHVRIYSKNNFVEKLQSGGFKVEQYTINYFGAETFNEYGIHPRSVLYLVEKK